MKSLILFLFLFSTTSYAEKLPAKWALYVQIIDLQKPNEYFYQKDYKNVKEQKLEIKLPELFKQLSCSLGEVSHLKLKWLASSRRLLLCEVDSLKFETVASVDQVLTSSKTLLDSHTYYDQEALRIYYKNYFILLYVVSEADNYISNKEMCLQNPTQTTEKK